MRSWRANRVAALILLSVLVVGCESSSVPPAAETASEAALHDDGAVGMVGHYRSVGEDSMFRACAEEAEHPVVSEGDAASLERAYRDTATKTAEWLLVRLEGNVIWQPTFDPATERAGEKQRAWYVERFVGLETGGTCP